MGGAGCIVLGEKVCYSGVIRDLAQSKSELDDNSGGIPRPRIRLTITR